MQEAMVFKYNNVLCILLINILFIKEGVSEVYNVGGDRGWDSETNYASWSQKYNFSVNDVLVFSYTKGQHNVYEVTEATYRSCDASTGVLTKYDSGDDRVDLKDAKKYWFICNVDGHCQGRMRFGIDVSEAKNTNPPSPQTPPNSSTVLSYERGMSILIVAFGVLLGRNFYLI